jgi:Predicted S-adenosylmethionine-dependent methyltransferase involved in bacterial cell division
MALLSASDLGVSRETYDRFAIFVELLLKWNAKINLIGRATEEQVWQRHVFDCAQVATFGPKGGSWADFGAGAGLPGLIIAAINLEEKTYFQQ